MSRAAHVQAAISAAAQSKPAAPSRAGVARHVEAAISASVQAKPEPRAHRPQPAAHVQAALSPGKTPAAVRGRSGAIQRAGYGSNTTAPQPGKLEYDSSTDNTTAMIILWNAAGGLVCERTFGSGGGLHAEEKAIAYLQGLVNNGTCTPGSGPYHLFIQTSKSPCSSTAVPATRTDGNPGCLERLTNLNANGLNNALGQNVAFVVQIASTKPYQPKIPGGKNSSINSYQGFGGGGGSGAFGFVR